MQYLYFILVLYISYIPSYLNLTHYNKILIINKNSFIHSKIFFYIYYPYSTHINTSLHHPDWSRIIKSTEMIITPQIDSFSRCIVFTLHI